MSSATISSLGKGADRLNPEVAQALAALPKPPPPPEDVDADQFLLGVQPVVASMHEAAVVQMGEGKCMLR